MEVEVTDIGDNIGGQCTIQTVDMTRVKLPLEDEYDSARSMFGCMPADALAVHRHQSKQIHSSILFVDASFTEGQVNVALSRSTSIQSTYIIGCGCGELTDEVKQKVANAIWAKVEVPKAGKTMENYFGYTARGEGLQPIPFPE